MQEYTLFPNLFVHRVSEKDVAIFHPFRFCIFYLSIQEYNHLINKQWDDLRKNGVLDSLLENRIVCAKLFNYDYLLQNVKERYFNRKGPFIDIVYFIVSNYCNISCAYCSLKTKRTISSSKLLMSNQEGIDAISFLLEGLPQNKDLPLTVKFYGGEPLLNFPALKVIIGFLRMLELKGKFRRGKLILSINTNGTLITKEIAHFLVRQGVNVNISLDGYSYLHNQPRFGKNTKVLFNKALKGYRLIKEAGGRASISTTIGSFNVDTLPDIAYNFVTKWKIPALGFNLMRESYLKETPCQTSMEKVGRVIFDCYEIFRRHGIYEDRVGRYVRAIQEKKIRNYCAGYGRELVFLPGGDILPCHMLFPVKKYKLGNIYHDSISSIMKKAVFKKWYSRISLAIPKCKYCPAMLFCGGGCVQQVVTKGRSFWDIDEKTCQYFKMFLEWYVKDVYKEAVKQKRNKDKNYIWITKGDRAFNRRVIID